MIRHMMRLVMVLGVMLLPIACLPPANSEVTIDGCPGSAVQKVSPWGKTIGVPMGPVDEDMMLRFGATSTYWFCPNGSNPNKIKVTKFGMCITKLDNRDSLIYRGFEYNPYYGTLSGPDEDDVNPSSHVINWIANGDIGDSRCNSKEISPDIQRWQRMPTDPIWSLSGWVKLEDWPDQDKTWYAGNNAYRYFNPPEDPNLNPFGD